MKFDVIGNHVRKTKQCSPESINRSFFTYIDISSVDRESRLIVAPQVIPVKEAPSRARKQVQANDVIISTVRPNLNTVALIPRRHDGDIASTGFCVLRANEKALDPKYLFYFSQNKDFVSHLTKVATGANYPAVSDADILGSEIPLPSLSEQERIAAILEKADRLRRLRRYAQQMSETYLQSVFVRMFGIPAAISPYWPTKTVGEIGKVQLGRQRAPQYQSGLFTRPYMRVANVYENRIDLSDVLSMDFDEKDFNDYKLMFGDILLNEGQSTELVGRPAMWRNEIQDCCFQNTLLRFQADKNQVEPLYALTVFIFYLRNGDFAKVSSKTSNVAHLGASRFADMKIPVPPLDLQHKFARIAERFHFFGIRLC